MYSTFRNTCERLLKIPPDPESPPGDEHSTRVFNAAPNYFRYLLILWALKSALVLFIVCMAVGMPTAVGAFALVQHGHHDGLLLLLIPSLVLVLAVLIRLFMLAVVSLEFEKRWYIVTDRSLRIRDGVISVQEMTVNFANIQNISISQGPVQRVLGIADVRVDTAGGGAVSGQQEKRENLHTAWFRGINNGNEIRELIQQRLRHLKDAGLGDHDDRSHAIPAAVTNSAASLAVLREMLTEAKKLREAAAGL